MNVKCCISAKATAFAGMITVVVEKYVSYAEQRPKLHGFELLLKRSSLSQHTTETARLH